MSAAELVERINTFIIYPLIYLLIGFGFVVFLWGLVEFIWQADSESARADGKRHMIWGVIGMFIMVAVFGVIELIKNTFGLF